MSKYFIYAAVTPTSEDWMAPYLEAVPPIVSRHGGRYLAQTTTYDRLEGTGENPTILVLAEFRDEQSARDFYDDPEYQPYKAQRLAGADSHMFLLPALEN